MASGQRVAQASAPFDYQLGIPPDWKLSHECDSTTMNNMNNTYLQNCAYAKGCEKVSNLAWETMNNNLDKPHPMDFKDNLWYSKRCIPNRTRNDNSVGESDYEVDDLPDNSCQTRRNSKSRIRKRRAIKVASSIAWVAAAPILLGINLMRDRNDDDEEDEKFDDPLRPWNYKVDYVRPHKR